MIDSIAMKGKQVIIPFILQNQILEQLHSNHIGIEKNKDSRKVISILGQHEYRHQNTVRQCITTCLEYQQTQPQDSYLMKYHADHGTWSVLTFSCLIIKHFCAF